MEMQLLDADYFLNGNKPVLRLFGRTESGNAVCAMLSSMRPYFYTNAGREQIASVIAATGAGANSHITAWHDGGAVEECEMYVPEGYGEAQKLRKVTLTNPQDVPKLREALEKQGSRCFEADILFKYRCMVDLGLRGMSWMSFDGTRVQSTRAKCACYEAKNARAMEKEGNAKLRYMAFDIECISPSDRSPEAKRDAIIMVSLAFMPAHAGRNTLVLVAKPFAGAGAKGFAGEKEMLEEFLSIVNDYDPDIITGYNINTFDLPYLTERLKKNGLPINFGRADKNVAAIGMTRTFSVPGRVVVDPYQIIKRDPWIKFLRYDLNTVAKQMLGEQKHDVEYKEMASLWNGPAEGIARLVEYSRRDAELSLRLVIERGIMDKFTELAKISGLLLQDAMGGQTRRIEVMLLHEFRKRGFVMPCLASHSEMLRRTKERDAKGLKGATVLEPEKGLHADGCVLVLDFKSLYPSIMRTYNISPDTVAAESSEKAHESPTGARFVDASLRSGIFPDILTKLISTRAAIKKATRTAKGEEKRSLNAKQLALKDMSNSVHANTDIVVKDPAGNVNVFEIEELFERLAKQHNKTVLGDTEVIEPEGWEALSVDGGGSCFRPMYAMSRHKYSGGMTRIQTPMSSATITDDHSIMIMKGKQSNRQRLSRFDALAEKGGKDVTEKDAIAQVRKIQLPEKEVTFSWLEFLQSLPEEDAAGIFLYVPKNLNLNKNNWLRNRAEMLAAMQGPTDSATLQNVVERRILRSSEGHLIERTGITTVGNCGLVPVYETTEEGAATLGFYSEFAGAREEAKYYALPVSAVRHLPKFIEARSFVAVGGPGQGRRKLPVKMPVTNELAELLGWFVAKGSTYRKKNSFKTTISNTDRQNVSRIKYLIRNCFSYDASLFNKDITMSTKLLYLFFRHLCGPSSYQKKIPGFIINSNSEKRRAFMKGYYSGDGNRGKHRINTASKRLAAQLNLLLKEHGGVQRNYFDGIYRLSQRGTSHGCKIVSGDLFGQRPKISRCPPSGYVYDLSVRGTEMFVTAQGTVLHNSFYGYTGYMRARLYMIDVANSITAYGRKNLKKTKKLIEENFPVKVIYADTDSAFVKTKMQDLDEAKRLGEEIARYVTGVLPGDLELEFEKIYRTFLILTKKRYAGWMFEYRDGWHDAIEMKGIETVRRDWCPLVSDVMNSVIETILKEGDIKKAIATVQSVIEQLKRNEVPAEKLTIVKGITKSVSSYAGMLPHIELARKLAARSAMSAPNIGDRLGFVILRGSDMLSKRAEDPRYAQAHGLAIDSDYYINSQLFPPVERIFAAIGVDRSEVFGGGRQVSLLSLGQKRATRKSAAGTGASAARGTTRAPHAGKQVEGWEEFICSACRKAHRRPSLSGLCECGGKLLISYKGDIGSKVVIK